jgi:hypothetical protein
VVNQWDLLVPLGIPAPEPDSHPTEFVPDHRPQTPSRLAERVGLGTDHLLVIVHVGARISSAVAERWP